jgi:hypothetical protein
VTPANFLTASTNLGPILAVTTGQFAAFLPVRHAGIWNEVTIFTPLFI